AIKIDPVYSGPVIYVKDASKTTGVVKPILSEEKKPLFLSELKKANERIRENHQKAKKINYSLLQNARKNKLPLDWDSYQPVVPAYYHTSGTGVVVLAPSLEVLIPWIDWTFFLFAWDISGKYPKILKDPIKGDAAKKLVDDGMELLKWLASDGRLSARGIFEIFPANSKMDDILIKDPDDPEQVIDTMYHLRNQEQKADGEANLCLSDFILPEDSGKVDYIGAFAVTAGLGLEEIVAEFEAEHDDYKAIMVKALADRLAEAFAEYMHFEVRTKYWGYSLDETFDIDTIICENYKGIRPAAGYPACPDHREKLTVFKLLEAEKHTHMKLTESLAMYPGASVSGIYIAHPESKYFYLGRVSLDQVEDYAERRGITVKEVEKFLSTNLNYR
ncbi:MAG: methionine synthase, partial [Bacteroidetes bacterium]|nr:methionine synthase [Bacteroidota bacterium]